MTSDGRQMPGDLEFPTSNPIGCTPAHLEAKQLVEGASTWSLQTLNLGPLRSSPSYAQHLRDTVGSSYDWSDELRFDKRTGRLTSFVLKTPEAGTLSLAIARSWLALPRRAGIPVIENREDGFHVDPLDLRYLAEEDNALIAADARMPQASGSSLRLAVAQDVDFLFHEGRYCGWVLERPLAHLVAEPGDAIPDSDEPRLHDLLREYLSLAIEPNLARMSDEDPAMQAALSSLCDRARAFDAAQARAIGTAAGRLLETFYPG